MAISKDQLGRDESIVASMHTHAKAMVVPALVAILLGSLLGFAIAFIPTDIQPWGTYVAIGIFVLFFVWLVLVPFLRWLTTTYTITDRRVITRRGIINKIGHDLPLKRINNVNYERSLSDRILGCGTLIFETAAGQPQTLPDVPHVERVHVMVTELLFASDDDDD
ncbi:PH domain-containing protein [Tessaracoccus bendigoensis DSM 12906]|uniref:PH domain-containing protein n=1 Tax=Tessaracoccus bendigoensis DSM 12906 TaxID=1123357 RepID=A0A1M6GY43_9ACTN|nr:PH domain-containing protein [Tessaracoccus bendigoensis]SHJ14873.1 PH domain-containing protein [Tessaracoccus bendigoensis DSM 12906]